MWNKLLIIEAILEYEALRASQQSAFQLKTLLDIEMAGFC